MTLVPGDFEDTVGSLAPTTDTAQLSRQLAAMLAGKSMITALSSSIGTLSCLLMSIDVGSRRQIIDKVIETLTEMKDFGEH